MHFLLQLLLDFLLDFIGKLHAVFGEEFDAVVGIVVVGGGNHHAGREAQRAGKIGHARGGQRAGLDNIHAGSGETGHQSGFQHIAGNAGVFADEHGGFDFVVAPGEHLACGISQPQYEIGCNRKFAHFAAHTIRAEIFFCHREILCSSRLQAE